MIEAIWTGKPKSLCIGKWILKVDGRDVSDKIPDDLKRHNM